MVQTQVPSKSTISALEFLCAELANIQPTPEELQTEFLKEYHEFPSDRGRAAWLLSEKHTQMRVERICRVYNFAHIFYLPQTTLAGDYIFFQHPPKPNITIRRKKSGKSTGEIDLVLMVENKLPVIIETDLSRYNNSGAYNDLGYALRAENIDKKRIPIQQLFGVNPEVVYVIPTEHLRKRRNPESNLCKFVKKGGRILPFYTTRVQFRSDIEKMIAHERRMTDVPENGYIVPLAV